jgi:hypothetical protein
MDLDTLIYIIVMIIFIALGAFGKKKKPGQQVSESSDGEEDVFMSPDDVIAQKLKAFLGDFEKNDKLADEPEPESEPVVQNDIKITQPPYYTNELYREPKESYLPPEPLPEEIPEKVNFFGDASDEGNPVFEHFNIGKDVGLSDGDLTKQEDPHTDGVLVEDLFAEFTDGLDPKKAIIYSEIINRKQF